MDFTKFNSIYSSERIKKYFRAAGKEEYKTMMLYYYNHRLGRAFQPLVSNVEVVLRNKLNGAIAKAYTDDKWLLHRVSGYTPTGKKAFTGRRPIVNRYLCDCLKKADDKLTRNHRKVEQDSLISELDFGFWTALYNDSLPNEVSAAVMGIFAPLPAGTNRQVVKGWLNRIRKFRNRICHNNTLFFDGGAVDVAGVWDTYVCIRDVSMYLDAEAYEEFDRNGLDRARRAIESLEFDINHPSLCRMRMLWRKWFV